MQVPSKPGRKLDADVGSPAANGLRHFRKAAHFVNDSKGLRVHKIVNELPRFGCAVLIENDCCDVFYVGIERIAKRDHFDDGREQHEKERERIAQYHEEFLVQNGRVTTERVSHENAPFELKS